MKVGFIGLGNLGAKLAGSLLRNNVPLMVLDLDTDVMARFAERGAQTARDAAQIAADNDVIITCLPSPKASDAVMTQMLPNMGAGKTWLEMSTTDAGEIKRLAAIVEATGARAVDCPVSGGCHRAATGNISIFAACDRDLFETVLPLLTILGRRVLHTGPVGSASTLKVMTNYLATTHLFALNEAFITMKAAGMDMATTFEAIKISSGNSFVHETESQLILSGSRDVNFTLDLIDKDLGLFQKIADDNNVPLTLSPKVLDMVHEGQAALGHDAQSDRTIELYEGPTGLQCLADGFPMELIDDEPEEKGYEVRPR